MTLETKRLILRPFKKTDFEAFAEINANPQVMRYFPKPYTPEQTAKMMEIWAQKQSRYGYAFSAAEEKETGVLLGMVGLSRLEEGIPLAPCTEIGWRLAPTAWGKGYASEAAAAWLNHGLETLGLSEILSFAPKLNIPSQKVMGRIGMNRAAHLDFDHPAIPNDSPLRPMAVYSTR